MNKLTSALRCVTALVVLPLLPLRAANDLPGLEEMEKRVQAVAEKATPCVVALTHAERKGMASGSGVIIGRNGLLLTAAHVVGDAKTVDVTFPDRKRFHAKVLGADYTRDVALAVITEPGDYSFMELGDTRNLAVGTMVVALGHPGGFDPQRNPPVRFGRVFEFDHNGYIRTDCTLVGGDSGGPLFDLDGKVIGVHSSVGVDISVNNDAPVEAVRSDWDRLLKGEHWGSNPAAERSKLTDAELGGLNLRRFQDLLIREATKNHGAVVTDPAAIAGWLKQCGMKEERIKAMNPAALAKFVQKALGGVAVLEPRGFGPGASSGAPAMTDEELGGLDLNKFRKRVIEDAAKHGGSIFASPDTIAQWLRECGMNEKKLLETMDTGPLINFVKKAIGGSASVHSRLAATAEGPAMPPEELAGLDLAKFRQRLVEEAMKSQGKLKTTPDVLAKWLAECGMNEERIRAMAPQEIGRFVRNAMGLGGKSGQPSKDAEVIAAQDEEILAAIKPSLDKVVPGVVRLFGGGKPLAMGTVVRENGFILTKHSEVAKAKNTLRARLSDGRIFPAVEVKQFAEHDLALVKIDADALPAATLPDEGAVLRPGTFVFTPGSRREEPMAGQGVVSVPDRSLKQTGGFLGIGLNDVGDAVEVTDVVPESPAAKAGLQKNDKIVALNDEPVGKAQDFSDRVRRLGPQTKVQLKFRRGQQEKRADVTLADRAKLLNGKRTDQPRLRIGTEVSSVRGGYPQVFQHDQPLNPEDCGGVVVDLHGEIVGVNIARADRVETYAIPVKVVAELLKTVDFDKLEETAAGSLHSKQKAE